MLQQNRKRLAIGICFTVFLTSVFSMQAQTDIFAPDQTKSPLVQAAQKVSDAVVSIGGTETRYFSRRVVDPFFEDFFQPFVLVPRDERISYRGTGFIVDPEGYIVTNYHVIEGESRELKNIFVTLPDRREFPAKIIDADRVVDIALLKIEADNLPSVKLGDSENLLIGEWSLAIGNPFGNYIQDPHPSVTVGVISALNRSFKPQPPQGRISRVYQGMIQTDAAINPGNSGGPLVNIRGEVIGVNTFIFSNVGGSHGIGFAIPINHVKRIIQEIQEYGHIRRLWLDFEVIDVTRGIAQRLGMDTTHGAMVINIADKEGPAAKSGLKLYDVILRFNNQPIRDKNDLIAYFASKQVGDTVTFTIFRNGEQMKINYKITESKPSS